MRAPFKVSQLVRKPKRDDDGGTSNIPKPAMVFYDRYLLKQPETLDTLHFLKLQLDITHNDKYYLLPIPPGIGKIYTLFCIGWCNKGEKTVFMDIVLQNALVCQKPIGVGPSMMEPHTDSFPSGSDFSSDKPYYHIDDECINPFISNGIVPPTTTYLDLSRCIKEAFEENDNTRYVPKMSMLGKCMAFVAEQDNYQGQPLKSVAGIRGALCYCLDDDYMQQWMKNFQEAWQTTENPRINLNEIKVTATSADSNVKLWLDFVVVYSSAVN